MANLYSNLPTKRPPDTSSSDGTVQVFNTYFSAPVELHGGTLNAMSGFFESRGFDQSTAKSIAAIIMVQADVDGYNPMSVLDNLTGLDGLEISELATQILNHNRYKTSFLGYTTALEPYHEIQRNIIEDKPKNPSYAVVSSADIISEGGSITFVISALNVKNVELLYWDLTGSTVDTDDITNGTTSSSVLVIDGNGVVTLGIPNDLVIEDQETLVFNLKTGSTSGPIVATASVQVVDPGDTSFIFNADYMVIEYIFTDGLDLDTRTKLVSPPVGTYVGWGLSDTVTNLLTFSGDNTGTGTESTLFRINNYKNSYPVTNNLKIDCRAQWYNAVGINPVGLKITLWAGGTMQKQGFTWSNPTATQSLIFAATVKQITLSSKVNASIGERIAVINYNTTTGEGFLDDTDTTVY
jgi:hypothetical protein